MKNIKISKLFPFLLFPFLIGATDDDMVHPDSTTLFKNVVDINQANILTHKYGHFKETELMALTKGKENEWYFISNFYRNSNDKIQMRLYYVYGQVAAFKNSSVGSKYYQVYRSPYWSGRIGSLFSARISLSGVMKDHGIKTDYQYKVFTANFVLGIYVDEHGDDYQGTFYYMYVPTTFNSGKRYHLNVGTVSNYVLRNNDYNENEYHRRVWYGGEKWTTRTDSIYDGLFVDWWDFKNEDRGECKYQYFNIPLKMRISQFTDTAYRNLLINNKADMNLFIYEGYERFNFGETSIGYDGKVGYKIPLKQSFDGTYVTFYPDTWFYVSIDGRRIYIPKTVPSGGDADFYLVQNGVPLPSIPGNVPTTFKFQIELLNVGALGLVDITAKFSYTKSKNFFGSNKTSSYYVEEEL